MRGVWFCPISVSWFIFSRRRPLKRLLQTWTGWVFKKGNTGSFLLQAVVDWLALHQEWLEENKYPFWRVTFEKTSKDLSKALLSSPGLARFCWWNCSQGQGYFVANPLIVVHRQLQTADFLCSQRMQSFHLKMQNWLPRCFFCQRKWDGDGWLTGSGRKEVLVNSSGGAGGTSLVHRLTVYHRRCLVTGAFYCYRPKISVTAVWPRWTRLP